MTGGPLSDLLSFSLFYNLLFSEGHLPASRGVRNCDSDWRHHGKSVLPGEHCPTEQVQGAGAGEALCGGDGLYPGQSFGCTGDQSPGPGFDKFQQWRSSSRTRVSSTVAQCVHRKKLTSVPRMLCICGAYMVQTFFFF